MVFFPFPRNHFMTTPPGINAVQSNFADKNVFALKHWQQKLEGVDFPRYLRPESEWDFAGASKIHSYRAKVDLATMEKLAQVATSLPAQHLVLTATLALLVQRYHAVEDVLLFTPCYHQHKSREKFIPCYIQLQVTENVQAYIRRIAGEWGVDSRYSIASFSEAGLPLGDGAAELPITALIVEGLQTLDTFDQYSGALIFKWHPQGELSLQVVDVLYNEVWLQNLAQHFLYLLQAVLVNPQQSIAELSMLSEVESTALFSAHQLEPTLNSSTQTIIDFFEEQVVSQGNRISVSNSQEYLSYATLATKMEQMAAFLITEHQVQKGDLIGIILDREIALMPCILGVLKAGGVFVPIDPTFPSGRKQSIIKDAQLKCLIFRGKTLDGLELGATTLIDLDQINLESLPTSSELFPTLSGTDLAYIIYTSGSTGRPKGVMIEHQALSNYIQWAVQQYCSQDQERFLLYSSISFDLTITSIFTPLVAGHEVVLQAKEIQENKLEALFGEQNCSIIKLTPSHLKLMRYLNPERLAAFSNLHTLIVGGEALEQQLASEVFHLFGGKLRIFNEYGPTEATVGCMIYAYNPVDEHLSVSIGRAIDHMQVFVLDAQQRVLPNGVTGDLYVAGVGLARGYWAQPELSAEKFITTSLGRLYHTGDLACRLEDGNLMYKGRKDEQVKINGHRIELGEVEHALQLYPGVCDVAVQVFEHQGERFLAAYYTADETISASEFRAFLSPRLSQYAIPFHYLHLPAIPLTGNGKLDRKKLPNALENKKTSYLAPRNAIEAKLLNIWQGILQIEKSKIGVTHSFFELGGNSIRSIYLVHSIMDHFSVELSVRDVFKHYTIADQSKLIEKSEGTTKSLSIKPGVKRKFYPASPAQQRMYFQQTLAPTFTGYNICSVLLMDHLDEGLLEKTLNQLLARHESLRTNFQLLNGEVVQLIRDESVLVLEQLGSSQRELTAVVDKFIRPFDLANDALLRVGLWRNTANQAVLCFDIHHIVADGLSSNILVKDFVELYNGKALEPLTLQYRDYSAWLFEQKETNAQQKQYWSKQLFGALPQLGLPTLRDKEMVESYSAQALNIRIEGAAYQALKNAIHSAGVSDFMYLLSVYYALIYKLTGNTDVIVGTDVLGRRELALHSIIGTFVNILPLRLQVDALVPFAEFLQQIKTLVLDAFEHQEFQFDEMLTLIHKESRSTRNPLVEVHFSLYNTFDQQQGLDQLSFQLLEVDRPLQTQYPLKIEIKELAEAFSVAFVFNDAIYEQATIELLSTYYYELLLAVLHEPNLSLDAIALG